MLNEEERGSMGQLHLHRKDNCKTLKNSNFLKNGKTVISIKIRNFSRSRMTKRISPLKSFCEKKRLPRRISSNSETAGFHVC